jgi:hypothetical protein
MNLKSADRAPQIALEAGAGRAAEQELQGSAAEQPQQEQRRDK